MPTFRAKGEDAERMFIAGRSGYGKTTLASSIVSPLARQGVDVVHFDSKGENELSLTPVEHAPGREAELMDLLDRHGAIAVRPDLFNERERGETLGGVAEACYVRGNLLLVLDDAMTAAGQQPPLGVTALVAQGRSRGVGVMVIAQRPSNVPILFWTQAEHVVSFNVVGEADAKRLANIHPAFAEVGELERFEFLWHSERTGELWRSYTLGPR